MIESRQILLTGASGFLGNIILKALFAKNEVDTLGRNKYSTYQVDLSDSTPVITKTYDIIFHAAGKAHMVPKTAEEKEDFFKVNFEGTKNLCNALLNNKPSAFIYISTVAVYGKDSGELISEDHPLDGTSPYAKSKILTEKWLTEWAATNNVRLSILRLPLVSGPNPPGNLGAMINGIRSGKYLSIGKATAKKSVVWAEDIAQIIFELADKGGIYNLTDGYHPSFSELEECIAGSLKKKKPIRVPLFVAKALALVGDLTGKFPINSNKLEKITSTLTFDDSKARNKLGWKPSSTLAKIPTIL